MNLQAQQPGDAEVPILVHSSLQPTVVKGMSHLQRPVDPAWLDKAVSGPSQGGPVDQGNASASAMAAQGPPHLVPQMSPVEAQANRLTRAQQSELEMARRRAQKAAQGKAANSASARRAKRRASDQEHHGSDNELQQKLSTVTDEKEAKRLKRLLRNRVSAQQARERKKSYVSTLEEKCRLQEQRLAEFEQRVRTLERENVMLRSVMKNMQGGDMQPCDVRSEAAVPVIAGFSQPGTI